MLITIPVRKFRAWFNAPEFFPRFSFFKKCFFNRYEQICSFLVLILHFCDFKKSILRSTYTDTKEQSKAPTGVGGHGEPSSGNPVTCTFNILSQNL